MSKCKICKNGDCCFLALICIPGDLNYKYFELNEKNNS